LGLRVLMKIKIGDREIVAPVLVNSGFESDESEIIVPYSMIERMGLWLPVRYLLETKGILGTRTGFPPRPPHPLGGPSGATSTGTTIDVPSRVYKSWGFHDG